MQTLETALSNHDVSRLLRGTIQRTAQELAWHETRTALPSTSQPQPPRNTASRPRNPSLRRLARVVDDSSDSSDGDDAVAVLSDVSSSNYGDGDDSDYMEGPAPLCRPRSRYGRDGLTRQQRAEQRQRRVWGSDSDSDDAMGQRPQRSSRRSRRRATYAEGNSSIRDTDSDEYVHSDSSGGARRCV